MGLHPEVGAYWKRATKESEETYQRYLQDVGVSRVSIQPREKLYRTEIEIRIEGKLRTLLMSAVPYTIGQQCLFQEDLTCSQILCHTMVLAGPATMEDREITRKLLTNPRVIELGKIHDQLTLWAFATNR